MNRLMEKALEDQSVLRGGLPPPDVLYRISTIRSAEKYLPNNHLKLLPK